MYHVDGEYWITGTAAARLLAIAPDKLVQRWDFYGLRRRQIGEREAPVYALRDVERRARETGAMPSTPTKASASTPQVKQAKRRTVHA